MASVPLRFVPPNDTADLTTLHIFEAPASTGPWVEIDTVTAIGTQGSYIDHYTTDLASSETDWFMIQWEDSKGGKSEPSAAIQGGTTTLVSEIVSRVSLRDANVSEEVAAQEAEAAIESIFGTTAIDPATVTRQELSGLTLLTLARCYLMVVYAFQHAQKFSSGLISVDTGVKSARTLDDIQKLINAANTLLGRNYSAILLMEEVTVADGVKQLVDVDVSRLIVEYD